MLAPRNNQAHPLHHLTPLDPIHWPSSLTRWRLQPPQPRRGRHLPRRRSTRPRAPSTSSRRPRGAPAQSGFRPTSRAVLGPRRASKLSCGKTNPYPIRQRRPSAPNHHPTPCSRPSPRPNRSPRHTRSSTCPSTPSSSMPAGGGDNSACVHRETRRPRQIRPSLAFPGPLGKGRRAMPRK